MQWQINNIDNSCHYINIANPDITIYNDASLTGWGITDGLSPSRELCHKTESEHINVLELKAIGIEIYTYCKNKDFLHVRVNFLHVNVQLYVMPTIQGQQISTCNNIACRIWDFCCGFQQHIYQEQSILRQISNLQYWRMLLSENSVLLFFNKQQKDLENQTQISLLLELISNQIDMFWHPEPEAMAINASSLTWNKNYFCKFPPFSLAGQVLAKIHRDKTHAVIVVPDWSTQYWYPQLIQMTNQDPLYFRPSPRNSTLPHHPLYKKLQLIAIRVIILQKIFQKHLLDYPHIANIIITLNNRHLILKIQVILKYLMYWIFQVEYLIRDILTQQLIVENIQQPPLSIYPLTIH